MELNSADFIQMDNGIKKYEEKFGNRLYHYTSLNAFLGPQKGITYVKTIYLILKYSLKKYCEHKGRNSIEVSKFIASRDFSNK